MILVEVRIIGEQGRQHRQDVYTIEPYYANEEEVRAQLQDFIRSLSSTYSR